MSRRDLTTAVYHRLLREATLDDLNTSSMAVVTDETSGGRTAVVYDTAVVAAHSDPSREIPRKAVIGFVQIAAPRGAACRGAWQVKGITGPGKIVYSLAYAMSPTGLIVPDRSNVSPSASSAWKGYAAKADADNILPLDDADHPKAGTDPYHDAHHTPDAADDCFTSHEEEHLNAAYRGRGGEGALLDRLMDAHEVLMQKLSAEGVVTADLEAAILDAGYTAFDAVMGY